MRGNRAGIFPGYSFVQQLSIFRIQLILAAKPRNEYFLSDLQPSDVADVICTKGFFDTCFSFGIRQSKITHQYLEQVITRPYRVLTEGSAGNCLMPHLANLCGSSVRLD